MLLMIWNHSLNRFLCSNLNVSKSVKILECLYIDKKMSEKELQSNISFILEQYNLKQVEFVDLLNRGCLFKFFASICLIKSKYWE